jgi:hypothetical protein
MLCLIAKLSEEATEQLRYVQKAADPDSVLWKPLHGHITIAAYTGVEEKEFIRFCREQMAGISSFAVQYQKIELLEDTSIVVAVPEKAGMLEKIHRRITEKYNDDLDRWTKTDSWYPHTTLFFSPGEDLQKVYRKLADAFVPFSARVCGAEFSRVLDTGYEIIDRINFTV